MAVLDDAWHSWLALNTKRGCSAESMTEAMVEAGFEEAIAREAVRRSSAEATTSGGVAAEIVRTMPRGYRYEPSAIDRGNTLHLQNREVEVLMRCERPEIVVFGNLLSEDECERMIERSREGLRRSTIVNPDTGVAEVIQNRSSEGVWFRRGQDELIARLEQRFASLMKMPIQNGEGLQVLHYRAGGEYRPHFDYFEPKQGGSNVHLRGGGQRVATLIVYLNDVESGGETIFPEVAISVVARRGSAVYFRYMNEQRQLDPLTLHGGAPVTAGEKWIMTKWVRERPYV